MNKTTTQAPDLRLILFHYGAGAIALLVASLFIFLSAAVFKGHYFQPRLLAITHLLALGWGTMIITGASYQLLPVLLDVNLYSNRLGYFTFATLLPGVVLLVCSFWQFDIGWCMQLGAVLVLLALCTYAVNIYCTARIKKEQGIAAECLVTATIWLTLTGILGVLLVLNLRYAFLPETHLHYLKLHAHIGIAGWFLLLIIGVGTKLLPMFLLSEVTSFRRIQVAYYCINVGLVLLLADSLFFHTYERAWIYGLFILVGVGAFLYFIAGAYKKAGRKKMDAPMQQSMVAVCSMLLPALCFFGLKLWNGKVLTEQIQLANLYGYSIFMGFITMLILGQTFKTLPYIVWMQRYQPLIGKVRTHTLPRDLYSERWVRIQLYCYIPGYILSLAGIAFSVSWLLWVGTAGVVVTAVFYNLNVWKILFHRVVTQ